MKVLPSQHGSSANSLNGLGRFHKPRLSDLLRSLALDVTYHRGEGDHLFYRDDEGREVRVLDLVGGYGSLLLGHAHPALVAEAQKFLTERRPIHVQGSIRGMAERLAQELSRRANGDFCVTFANSGAEAVEAAMKHAMLETGSRTFITLAGAFHGKTLGALQLTDDGSDEWNLPGLNVVRVRLNDLQDLEAAFARTERVAGFVFEPIAGEGGVRPLQAEFARRAAALCRERNIPVIADECQTGMGRTGTFLASEAIPLQPDYIILSKALGGGLAKIAAVLIRRERYVDVFDFKHTSTFADDDFSCAIALKTLELIDDATLAACREKGERCRAGLRELQNEFPGTIADVRARGLMIGLQLARPERSASFVLRSLAAGEQLPFIVAGYLLNVHQIRIAPTLSDPFTLRLEPSAGITNSQIDRFLAAMNDVCQRLEADDAIGLTEFVVNRRAAVSDRPAAMPSGREVFPFDAERFDQRQRNVPAIRVAWLCHLIDADDLMALEPAFGTLPFERREAFLDQFGPRAEPVVMSSVDVRSQTGQTARLYPILLPVTSRWMKRSIDARRTDILQSLVQRGVDAAHALQCGMVSLGQYTSISTMNGRRLDSCGMGLTSGNSYAIALAIQAVRRAQFEHGLAPSESTLAILGAAGNIGRTCADIMAPRYGQTILVGTNRPGSCARLQNYFRHIPNARITTDLAEVAAADVVVTATNSVDILLGPDHLASGAIVCDVSVPSSVQPGIAAVRPDVTIIKGGIVRLPHEEDLQFVGFPLPPGQTYGCMAEGILLGLEGVRDTTFTGTLTQQQVQRIELMAQRHGFRLADYKTSCVLGSQREQYDVAVC